MIGPQCLVRNVDPSTSVNPCPEWYDAGVDMQGNASAETRSGNGHLSVVLSGPALKDTALQAVVLLEVESRGVGQEQESDQEAWPREVWEGVWCWAELGCRSSEIDVSEMALHKS